MEEGSPKRGKRLVIPNIEEFAAGDQGAPEQSLGPTGWKWPSGEPSTQRSMSEEPQQHQEPSLRSDIPQLAYMSSSTHTVGVSDMYIFGFVG